MVAPSVLDGHISINVSARVTAPGEPANFIIQGRPEDVASYTRQGNDLVIKMKAGRTYKITNFAGHGADYNNLVFVQDKVQTLVDLSSALGSTTEGILAPGLIVTETIGAGASVGTLLGILGAAGAVGGIAAAAGGGNEEGTSAPGEGPASEPSGIIVDTTAPSDPTILQMSNDFNEPGDFETYAGASILSGRAEAGSTVEIFVDGVSIGTVVADETGIWQSPSIDLSGLVPGETATVTTTATDTAGNVSGVTTQVITKAEPGVSIVINAAALTPAQGFIIQGDTTSENQGWSVSSAGDVNGDGVDDLVVGAAYGGDGGSYAGEAYVIFGTTDGFGTDVDGRRVIDLTTLGASQGFIIQGGTDYGFLGYSVSSAGDVNDDGINDLIIGAYNAGGTGAGEAYVIFGTTQGFGASDAGGRMVIDTTMLTASQGFIIQGDTVGDNLGVAVSSAGDVNGDGIADFIVGARLGDDGGDSAGEAYVIFGTTQGFGADVDGRMVIDLTTLGASQGFIIQGDTEGDFLGVSVSSAGDVNGDSIDDIIVGSQYGGDGDKVNAGTAYVIFGTTAGFGASDVDGRRVIDLTTLGASEGFIIQGDANFNYLGNSVSSAGDVNGDGIDDIIVGAPNGNDRGTGAGEAYVIFGTTDGFGTADVNGRMVIDLTTLGASQGFIIQGDSGYDFLGYSVSSAGDVNGDGIGDLIVGAYGSDDAAYDSGTAYVIYGTTQGFGTADGNGRMVLSTTALNASQGFLIEGAAPSDSLGQAVSAAGDINGDGYDDLIVGSTSNGDGGEDAGAAYVIFGTVGEGRVVTGSAGADFIAGTSYADHLIGGGGADVLLGHEGNDTIVVQNTAFARIDGGAGNDRLLLSGSGLHLDFTALGKDVVTGIETIDITGAGANTLKLTAQDVLDLSSTTNILIVDGSSDDTVNASGFSVSGGPQTIGANTYNVYTNGAATIWLDQEITNVVVA